MSSLQEAREAIQSSNLTSAQAIIAEVLKSNQNNAEAWFLLSEATEGDRKFIFLNKALNLDPNLEEAIKRKAQLEGTAEPEPEPEPIQEVAEEPEFPVISPANFEGFGEEKEDVPVEAAVTPDPAAPETSSSIGTTPAKEEKEQEQKTEKEKEKEKKSEPAPSNMVNTIGFAFSLALSAVLFILFMSAVMDLFN